MVRMPRQLSSDLDSWIAGQPGPRLGRPEAIRRLVTERLAGQAAPVDNELGEVRSRLILLARKVDGVVAYAMRVEEERDALAARAAKLEVVRPTGEQFAVRQSPREPPAVERWPADRRGDPETVARARAQLAAAEAKAEARRREENAARPD